MVTLASKSTLQFVSLNASSSSRKSAPAISRKLSVRKTVSCSLESHAADKLVVRSLLCGVAASVILLSPSNQLLAEEAPNPNSICLLSKENSFPLDETIEDGRLMMMRGMTAKDFDPARYAGRWFEVASLKRGFAGQGQEDCHCTQGVYTYKVAAAAIQVDTFCVHGGPDGYLTGIRGRVQCLAEEDLDKKETNLEKKEMIKAKCYLKFPTLPFIPKEPYDVIATDYDNYALVSGAKDQSFIQIYSRKPDPGQEFIQKYKDYVADFGYDSSQIKDTPQDCEAISGDNLEAMMSAPGMEATLNNRFPDIGLKAPVEFNPFSSVFETFKKLIELYFK